MPKSEGQKLKLLCLKDILFERTDDTHSLGVAQIIASLASYGIKAERKSIYNDIETLCDYGIDIICEKGRENRYYVGSRDFELAELKLLADSVASSAFITARKSDSLIKKIGRLTSKYEATQIYRQVFVEHRIKANNEKIYYNVDNIHRAIAEGKQISFKYFAFNIDKQKQYRSEEKYCCSPFAMTYSNDHYYVIAYYPKYNGLSSFRVDRMDSVTVSEQRSAENPTLKSFDITEYCKKNFSMFCGETKIVSMIFENDLVDTVLDRFGSEINLRKNDSTHFEISASVGVSPQFFGWIFGLGSKAVITAPQDVREQFKNYISSIENLYR